MPYTGEQKREYDRRWMAQRRDEWVAANGPCRGCGSTKDLEVDHINPALKTMEVRAIWSRRRMVREAELAKCQVLCASCHKRKTAVNLGFVTGHGTNDMYSNRDCRCEPCRQAHSAAMRDWYIRKDINEKRRTARRSRVVIVGT